MTRAWLLSAAITTLGCASTPAPTTITLPAVEAAAASDPAASTPRPSAGPAKPPPSDDEHEPTAGDLFGESGPKCYRACLHLLDMDARTCSLACSEF
jgi:hypothetical protein